jgi:2-C-methyl-D-erythritol 2,4-cyclodiphosphate synthase
MRIGMGYDVHRLESGRDLIVGGVKIEYEKGLLGHSDADVLTHAIMDAILGAACLGDIGLHFPDTAGEYKDISSIVLLERVRDLFIFQTYTCLRYSDLALFDASLIQEIKGMKVYIRKAKKTNKQFTVPILPPAWDILMKYEGKLPIISNVKYNLYLKNVAQAAGLDIKLTTHWARHTGATLLINEGVDGKIIKKICGHSSIKITEQIYAKLLDETVVDAVQDLDI